MLSHPQLQERCTANYSCRKVQPDPLLQAQYHRANLLSGR
uniref:Uncharacterized protein n=1 Tax=Triticum urartu TaxID=4572 RepID=A0A8R7UFA2_TRIUA